jgi:hypothetical protein
VEGARAHTLLRPRRYRDSGRAQGCGCLFLEARLAGGVAELEEGLPTLGTVFALVGTRREGDPPLSVFTADRAFVDPQAGLAEGEGAETPQGILLIWVEVECLDLHGISLAGTFEVLMRAAAGSTGRRFSGSGS